MKLVKTFGKSEKAAAALIQSVERRGAVNTARVEAVVATILADVRHGGDSAVEEYAGRFDGLKLEDSSLLPLRVTRDEMEKAWNETSAELREALTVVRKNIREFAEKQKPAEWMISPAAGVEPASWCAGLIASAATFPAGATPCRAPSS